jgi:hypothetical protein
MEVIDLKAPEPVLGTPPWQDPQWLTDAQDWIDAACAGATLARTGPVLVRARPYSVVGRVPTDRGTVWFKASPPPSRFEPALLTALAIWQPDRFTAPIAVDRALLLALRIAPMARALTWGRLFPCYLGHPDPAGNAARALAAILEEPHPPGLGELER